MRNIVDQLWIGTTTNPAELYFWCCWGRIISPTAKTNPYHQNEMRFQIFHIRCFLCCWFRWCPVLGTLGCTRLPLHPSFFSPLCKYCHCLCLFLSMSLSSLIVIDIHPNISKAVLGCLSLCVCVLWVCLREDILIQARCALGSSTGWKLQRA